MQIILTEEEYNDLKQRAVVGDGVINHKVALEKEAIYKQIRTIVENQMGGSYPNHLETLRLIMKVIKAVS